MKADAPNPRDDAASILNAASRGGIPDCWVPIVESVAAAYLAEHPADDDDPITDEWLIDEWGFYGDGADVLHRWVTDKIRLYRLKSFGNRVMYSSGHVHAVNRGEVRRMAAGFGLMRNPHTGRK